MIVRILLPRVRAGLLFKIAAMLLFIVGLSLSLGASSLAATDPNTKSVGLVAEIPSPPPKNAATIAVPTNGQSFTSLPIKISGLCTGDVLVKMFDNGVFIGSAQCGNGSYSLSSDLFDGKNELMARVYDALDQQGPDSAKITINFSQPGYNTGTPRVTLTSDYAKRGVDPKQTLSWPIVVSGGSGPYAASIDWGDGTNQLKSVSLPGTFNIDHIYDAPGLHAIVIKVTDNEGMSAFIQLVGVANGALSQVNQKTDSSSGSTIVTQVRYVWWPIILAALLIVVSFWLGARSKLVNLRKQAEKRIQY